MLPSIFRRFSEREKILMACLVLLILGFWIAGSIQWTGRLFSQKERIFDDEKYQNALILEGPLVKNQLEEKISQIDQSRTLDSSHLVGRVDKLARLAGLVYELSTPKTVNGDLLDLHRVMLTVRQASLGKLISFQTSIQEDFPYLSVTNAKLSAVPSNPTLLDATFAISAFELKSSSKTISSSSLPTS